MDDGWREEKLDLLRCAKERLRIDVVTHDQRTYDVMKAEFSITKIDVSKKGRGALYYLLKLFAKDLPTNNVRYRRAILLRTGPLRQRIMYLCHYLAQAANIFVQYRYCDVFRYVYRNSDVYTDLLSNYDVFLFCPVHTTDKRIVYEAKNLGLTVVCWVYSWDNPMKDDEFIPDLDKYFVWNGQCSDWLRKLHPVPRERVECVGPLQFEVLQFRMKAEYGVDLSLTPLRYSVARWPKKELADDDFRYSTTTKRLLDRDEKAVLLFDTEWTYQRARDKYADLEL